MNSFNRPAVQELQVLHSNELPEMLTSLTMAFFSIFAVNRLLSVGSRVCFIVSQRLPVRRDVVCGNDNDGYRDGDPLLVLLLALTEFCRQGIVTLARERRHERSNSLMSECRERKRIGASDARCRWRRGGGCH